MCDHDRRKLQFLRSNDSLVTGAGTTKACPQSKSSMCQTGEIIRKHIRSELVLNHPSLWSQFTKIKRICQSDLLIILQSFPLFEFLWCVIDLAGAFRLFMLMVEVAANADTCAKGFPSGKVTPATMSNAS